MRSWLGMSRGARKNEAQLSPRDRATSHVSGVKKVVTFLIFVTF